TSSFTYEAWVHASTGGSTKAIVAAQSGSNYAQLCITAGGNPQWTVSDTTFLSGSAWVADSQWHHLVGTYDLASRSAALYVDGSLLNSTTGLSATAINAPILVGMDHTGASLPFTGWDDEVHVYNYAKSADEVSVTWNRTPQGREYGLLAQWSFDEGSGTTVASETTDHTALSLAGGSASWIASGPTLTQTNYGLSFDGVDDRVDLGSNFGLANHDFSIETWAYRDTGNTDDWIVGNDTLALNQGLRFGYRDNSFLLAFNGNDVAYVDSDANTGEWVHWAATYDAATNRQTLYKNGAKVTENTTTADFSGTSNLFIGWGNDGDPTRSFDGRLDEVRIWDDVRTAAEIADNYAKRLSGSESNLVGLWHLDEGRGTTAFNVAGSGNDGTLLNGTAWDNLNAESVARSAAIDLHPLGEWNQGAGLTYSLIGGTTYGSATIDAGSGVVHYTAGASAGNDQVSYQVTDVAGHTATGVVDVAVF
ncbi:MAG: LamG domain-containing protein, partial [Magnetospirillum sp.]|nr:LamG domain-containing protein [Magnetospirillum sp.]